jgi:hypothetical protein
MDQFIFYLGDFMIRCNKACGQCCSVIILKPHINFDKILPCEGVWFKKHFTKVPRRDAINLNPHIAVLKNYGYYKCDYYDYSTHLCMGYNDRLPMCINFPFYNNVVLDCTHFDHLPDCYFINQLMLWGT